MILNMSRGSGYFAPLTERSSLKHTAYVVSSWALLLASPLILIAILSTGLVGVLSGFLISSPILWVLTRVLDFERWRANALLDAQIQIVDDVARGGPRWMREALSSFTTARGIVFLGAHWLFASATFLLFGFMLYLAGVMIAAPLIAAWQPAANQYSYWRDSILWTGSVGLQFTMTSAIVSFIAAIPMLVLTLSLSDAAARAWRSVAQSLLSNDKSATQAIRALEAASSSVLSDDTSTALQTILREGVQASSAKGAAIDEQHYPLEGSYDKPPALRVPLEQNSELLAYYDHVPPSARDANLWKALGVQASTALRLQHLLTRERANASEQERQRIARELHDSVSQALYGISLGTRSALEQFEGNPEHAKKALEYAMDLADGGTAEMKTLLFALRPDALEEGGLVAALHKLGEMLRVRYKLEASIETMDEPNWSLEVKGALYRIAQEAAHNTVKHARAKKIWVRLSSTALELEDDGRGFDVQEPRAGALGLKSMRERAEAIGAIFEVTSSRGRGTRIHVKLEGLK
jgi:signal transduction histidine kinase